MPPGVKARCCRRMSCWAALAIRVLQAEYPSFCIQACFSVFMLGSAGGRKLYGEDSDQVGAFNSHVERLANYCNVDKTELAKQLHTVLPVAEHAYKQKCGCTYIDAWRT